MYIKIQEISLLWKIDANKIRKDQPIWFVYSSASVLTCGTRECCRGKVDVVIGHPPTPLIPHVCTLSVIFPNRLAVNIDSRVFLLKIVAVDDHCQLITARCLHREMQPLISFHAQNAILIRDICGAFHLKVFSFYMKKR